MRNKRTMGNLRAPSDPASSQIAAVPAQGKASLASPTILLIDDNAVQAATRKEILKRSDYFVIAVLSPQRALEQFRNQEYAEDIRLVITDHVMPGMTGAAFVRALREIHPSMPVMVISGLEEAEEEYAGLNVLFRLKPLMPDALLENVRSLLHKEADAPSSAHTADPIRIAD